MSKTSRIWFCLAHYSLAMSTTQRPAILARIWRTFPKLIWIISPLQSILGSQSWKSTGRCSLLQQQLILRDFRWIIMFFVLDVTTTSTVHCAKSESFPPAWLVSLASGFRWYCNLCSDQHVVGINYKALTSQSLCKGINWPIKPGK